MKKIILTLFLVLSLPCLADTVPGMVVTMSSGDVKEYIISNIEKITYSGSDMIITTVTNGNETISTDNIKNIKLSAVSPTAINGVNAHSTERLPYTLYTEDGKFLGKGKVTVGGSLPIQNLPNGKYLIDLNGKTIKVVK